jgi:hypothetical protein
MWVQIHEYYKLTGQAHLLVAVIYLKHKEA